MAQRSGDNLRIRTIHPETYFQNLDSLSIIPGSLLVEFMGEALSPAWYELNESRASIRIIKTGFSDTDSLRISYRVFPISFSKDYFRRDLSKTEKKLPEEKISYLTFQPSVSGGIFQGLEGLSRSGSISRGISIGNNQDAVVNSSLNLQLAGKVANQIDLIAVITDENIPVQAEGNTQTLQEFDKVFIQLSKDAHKLIVGNYDALSPPNHFLRYFKKGQGGVYEMQNLRLKDNSYLSGKAGAAISRGKFSRYTFNGVESNQGPYRLRGASGENYVIVLSGSERVFIDGIPMVRGQNNDYTIDYNTAEITFTARRIITKDSRIVVEFQYSERNFVRTMLEAGANWRKKGLDSYVYYFSEQDNKNQTQQQSLTDEDKKILAGAGDDLSLAVRLNADSVSYSSTEILYALQDSLSGGILYDTIFRYSTNPDSARYRVGFSFTGAGLGDYIAIDGVASGRIYQWVAPINGVQQGSYAPFSQIIAPALNSMLVAGFRQQFKGNTGIQADFSLSREDLNLLSDLDDGNNNGLAAHIRLDQRYSLANDWNLYGEIRTEITGDGFKSIENYRPVEFVRDWNVKSIMADEGDGLLSASVQATKGRKFTSGYRINGYQRDDSYQGIMQIFNARWTGTKLIGGADLSFLQSDDSVNTNRFLRHKEDLSYRGGNWQPGLRFEQESNAIRTRGDSLSASSLSFRFAEVSISRPDSVAFPLRAYVSRRWDDGIDGTEFRQAATADQAGLQSTVRLGNNRINGVITYRNIRVKDSLITLIRPDESVLGRLEYSLNTWKNALTLNFYYEGGSGREQRRSYSYVQTAPGQGTYAWRDYNGDGVPQATEFEIANFVDEADYIRVFVPTEDFVKVYFNQFNLVFTLNPQALSNTQAWWKKFSFQSALRSDNRISDDRDGIWNPLPGSFSDTSLLYNLASSRNTLSFNRNNPKFNMEIGRQDQESRQLLSNGIEGVRSGNWNERFRWNPGKWLGFQLDMNQGIKTSSSEGLKQRNYRLDIYEITPQIIFQSGTSYRLNITLRNDEKQNKLAESAGEKGLVRDLGAEFRYSSLKRGVLTARLNYIQIEYNAETNTPVAYEILEGLNPGNNITWGLNLQRNIGSFLQLNFNYEGRKPAGVKTIHAGNAQVRAFF